MTTPVVFIHGLWLHATSWQSWIDLFTEAGYQPTAPEWPGGPATVEEARANPGAVAGYGITSVADHYAKIIADLDEKPVVIGHSFGGLIAQNLVGRGVTAAGIAIDAAPIEGVLALPVSSLRVAFVALRNPANRKRAISLTKDQFRFGFGNALTEDESAELFERWTIPSPGRPLFEAAVANFSPNSPAKVDAGNANRGPLLLISGGKDHTVPPAITKSTLKQYRKSDAVTEFKKFPDRGHSLTIDHGWREVAQASVDWLNSHSIKA
jgi:pimeloyl-ACP methyl ester carboxylesterase